MSVLFTRTLEIILFPPAINFIILAVGFILLLSKWRKIAVTLIAFSFGTFYLISTPWVASALMNTLQQSYPALTAADLQHNNAAAAPTHPCARGIGTSCPAAIVILGGGRKSRALEYAGADTVSKFTLERIRYGAYLHRLTRLPVLVTGGAPLSETTPEAQLMKAALENDFHIPVQWIEDKSHTTRENATFSQALLAKANIQHIYLVTHAWHMPRSVDVFNKTGLKITAAPTAFATPSPLEKGGYAWIPTARALDISNLALHEIVGRVWYSARN